MAQLLHAPWLARDVRNELSRGIDWFRKKNEVSGAVAVKREETEDGGKVSQLYEDDGSNLRISVSYEVEKRRCAQISEIVDTGKQVRFLLSDKHGSIPAKFTSSCAKAFHNKHGKQISETEHNIIAIHEYTIIATPYGEPFKQLSLDIVSMEYQGTLNVLFGSPKPIYQKDDIEFQLKRLREVKQSGSMPIVSQEAHGNPGRSDDDALAQSAEEIGDDMESSALYTQMQPLPPVPRRPTIDRSEQQSVGGVNRDGPTMAGTVRFRPDKEAEKLQEQSKKQQLLMLLSNRPMPNRTIQSLHAQTAADAPRNSHVPAALAPPNSESLERSYDHTSSFDKQMPISDDQPSSPPGPLMSPPSKPLSVVADDGAQNLQSPPLDVPASPCPNEIIACSWADGLSITQDQCCIPLEQAAILNRNHSWLPPLPGEHFPSPNIPIAVLKSLNELVGEALRNNNLEKEVSHSNDENSDAQTVASVVSSDAGQDAEEVSESSESSDLAIDWSRSPSLRSPSPRPPSHLQAGLPPDSSAPRIQSPIVVAVGRLSQTGPHSQSSPHPYSSAPQMKSSVRLAVRGSSQADAIEVFESDSGSEDFAAHGNNKRSAIESSARGLPTIPSSPPEPALQIAHTDEVNHTLNIGDDDDDDSDEMEFAVPEVLENSKAKVISPPPARQPSMQSPKTQKPPQIQVGETPNLQGQRKTQRDITKPSSSWSPTQQRSSGQTNSSASVIPSTYKDTRGEAGPRNVPAQQPSLQKTLSSEGDDTMVDKQLQGELEAASQRLPSSGKHDSSPDQGNARPTSIQSPVLVPRTSVSPRGSISKRKAMDLSTGLDYRDEKRLRPSGSLRPRQLDTENRDNTAPPMTVREQRRMKLNSYNSASLSSGEEGSLSHPRTIINLTKFNGTDGGAENIQGNNRRPSRMKELHSTPTPPHSTAREVSSTTHKGSLESLGGKVISKFSLAYPDYKGTQKQFLGMCKQIDTLQKQGKLHQAMWDDYVVRYQSDFAPYQKECFENGEEPLTYREFYNSFQKQRYRKGILDSESLKAVLEQDNRPSGALAVKPNIVPARRPPPSPAESNNQKRFRKSLPWSPSSSAPASGNSRSSLPSLPSKEQRSKPVLPAPGKIMADARQLSKEQQRRSVAMPHGKVVGEDRPETTTRTHGLLDKGGQTETRLVTETDAAAGEHEDAMTEAHEGMGEGEDEAGIGGLPLHADTNSPFRKFIRGYATLASVEGRLGKPDSGGILRPQRAKKIDVMAWPIGFKR